MANIALNELHGKTLDELQALTTTELPERMTRLGNELATLRAAHSAAAAQAEKHRMAGDGKKLVAVLAEVKNLEAAIEALEPDYDHAARLAGPLKDMLVVKEALANIAPLLERRHTTEASILLTLGQALRQAAAELASVKEQRRADLLTIAAETARVSFEARRYVPDVVTMHQFDANLLDNLMKQALATQAERDA